MSGAGIWSSSAESQPTSHRTASVFGSHKLLSSVRASMVRAMLLGLMSGTFRRRRVLGKPIEAVLRRVGKL